MRDLRQKRGMALVSNLLLRSLQHSLETHGLIGLHSTPNDPDKFTLGWVVALSDEGYVVATVDEVGRRDEFQFGFVDDLFMVVVGGHYIESLFRLMLNYPLEDSDQPQVADFDQLVDSAMNDQAAVFLYHRSDLTIKGFILDHDAEFLEVDAFSGTGLHEGRQVVRKSDIARLAYGGPDQRSIESFHRGSQG